MGLSVFFCLTDMTRFICCATFLIAFCALSACSEPAMTTFKTITPEEAQQKMQDAGVLVLDVREPMEYDRGHIVGAENLPLSVLENGIPKEMTDKNRTLLIYCRSGRRSKIAADIFVKAGFTSVFDFGGINDWPYRITR